MDISEALPGVRRLVLTTEILLCLTLVVAAVGVLSGQSPTAPGPWFGIGLASAEAWLARRLRARQSRKDRRVLHGVAVVAALSYAGAVLVILALLAAPHLLSHPAARFFLLLPGGPLALGMHAWVAFLSAGRDAVAWTTPACPRCQTFLLEGATLCSRCASRP